MTITKAKKSESEESKEFVLEREKELGTERTDITFSDEKKACLKFIFSVGASARSQRHPSRDAYARHTPDTRLTHQIVSADGCGPRMSNQWGGPMLGFDANNF